VDSKFTNNKLSGYDIVNRYSQRQNICLGMSVSSTSIKFHRVDLFTYDVKYQKLDPKWDFRYTIF